MPIPPSVAALLVSCDGARWLPGALAGLAEQTHRPDVVIAVDAGSRDDSASLLEAATPVVVRLSEQVGYPAAVRQGLDRLELEGGEPEWIWLLHDDARPAPDALAELLTAAEEHPGTDLLGPKLREWPSLRRLLEVGVTISGTGRRETGLERGEYDQGQHDDVRRVLAVNTAGLLIRREVLLGLDGLDPLLPVFGSDLDLGWRAAAAGHRTLVVPSAVVFHAEAAHRGLRTTDATGLHPHREERRAALYTLLANRNGRTLPLALIRLVFGTLLRALGFLLVRAPSRAVDELAALGSVLMHPRRLRAARRSRGGPGRPTPQVRGLLAPGWVPYRHGLDFVGDVVTAITHQASDVAERRRITAAEHDPSSMAARRVAEDDDEDAIAGSGINRFLTNPIAMGLVAVVALLTLAARTGFGTVVGGALSPVPDSVGHWWHLVTDSWHPVGLGTDVPATPLALPLALLGSVLGAQGAVALILVGAAPLALWGAWRLLRVLGRLMSPSGTPRWVLLVGATAYALVPMTSGAWSSGRLGVVLAAALLPWLGHAALGFAEPEADRRRRAGWRTGLLLTLVVCCAPIAWFVAVAVFLTLVAIARLVAGDLVRRRDVWQPIAVAALVPVVLLAAWWLPALAHGTWEALLLEPGRVPMAATGRFDLLTGRVGDTGPAATVAGLGWLGWVLPGLAALALAPRRTRLPVTVCWLVVLVAVVVGLLLSLPTLHVNGTTTPAGLGLPVVLVQGVLICAVVLGAQGLAVSGAGAVRAGPARGALLVFGVVAALVPVLGLGWALGHDGDLTSTETTAVPTYMVQRAVDEGAQYGVLVVTGDVGQGLHYVVHRGPVAIGDDQLLALQSPTRAQATAVRALLSRPDADVVEQVRRAGVAYVLMPAPIDGTVAAVLDAAPGLSQAGAPVGSRAWQLDRAPSAHSIEGPRSWWHTLLVVVELLGVAVVVVLTLPSLRNREEAPA